MKRSFYIYNNGLLSRKDNTIKFTDETGANRSIPIEIVDDINIMGEMDFNSSFINYISRYGICVHFFNYYSFYSGSYYPREKLVSGELLVKQVEHYSDNEKRLNIA